MARRPVTRELYAKLVAGFRDSPGNATHAARVADCERRMAKRGWEQGWPVLPWAEPIRRVIEREQLEAQERLRAEEVERARQAARVKDAAREDATKTHEEEGKLVKVARVNVMALLMASARLGPALQTLAEQVKNSIEANALTPKENAALLRNLAGATAQTVKAGQVALELERLHRGDPTQIIGFAPVEMTTEAALAELEAGQEELRWFKRRGFSVIEGGGGLSDPSSDSTTTPTTETAS